MKVKSKKKILQEIYNMIASIEGLKEKVKEISWNIEQKSKKQQKKKSSSSTFHYPEKTKNTPTIYV